VTRGAREPAALIQPFQDVEDEVEKLVGAVGDLEGVPWRGTFGEADVEDEGRQIEVEVGTAVFETLEEHVAGFVVGIVAADVGDDQVIVPSREAPFRLGRAARQVDDRAASAQDPAQRGVALLVVVDPQDLRARQEVAEPLHPPGELR
jgi:hypothetical protein